MNNIKCMWRLWCVLCVRTRYIIHGKWSRAGSLGNVIKLVLRLPFSFYYYTRKTSHSQLSTQHPGCPPIPWKNIKFFSGLCQNSTSVPSSQTFRLFVSVCVITIQKPTTTKCHQSRIRCILIPNRRLHSINIASWNLITHMPNCFRQIQ